MGRRGAALVYVAAGVLTPLSIMAAVVTEALPAYALAATVPSLFLAKPFAWALGDTREPVPHPALAPTSSGTLRPTPCWRSRSSQRRRCDETDGARSKSAHRTRERENGEPDGLRCLAGRGETRHGLRDRSGRPQRHRDTEASLGILCVSVTLWLFLRDSRPVERVLPRAERTLGKSRTRRGRKAMREFRHPPAPQEAGFVQ